MSYDGSAHRSQTSNRLAEVSGDGTVRNRSPDGRQSEGSCNTLIAAPGWVVRLRPSYPTRHRRNCVDRLAGIRSARPVSWKRRHLTGSSGSFVLRTVQLTTNRCPLSVDGADKHNARPQYGRAIRSGRRDSNPRRPPWQGPGWALTPGYYAGVRRRFKGGTLAATSGAR